MSQLVLGIPPETITVVVCKHRFGDLDLQELVAFHEDPLVATQLANALAQEADALRAALESWRSMRPVADIVIERDEAERIVATASHMLRRCISQWHLRMCDRPVFELVTLPRIEPAQWGESPLLKVAARMLGAGFVRPKIEDRMLEVRKHFIPRPPVTQEQIDEANANPLNLSRFIDAYDDDGEGGSRQSAPHPQGTQQGATTPGQSASSAAGNVAESHRIPVGHRDANPSSSPFVPIEVNERTVGVMHDQHVIPVEDGVIHRSVPDCWCEPRVDDGKPSPSGGRVWIHRTWSECFKYLCEGCAAAVDRLDCTMRCDACRARRGLPPLAELDDERNE